MVKGSFQIKINDFRKKNSENHLMPDYEHIAMFSAMEYEIEIICLMIKLYQIISINSRIY